MALSRLLLIALAAFITLPALADIETLAPAVRMEYDVIRTSLQDALAAINQPVAKLGDNYKAALEKRKAAAQAAGQLDHVIEADAALKSFAAGTPPTGEASDPEIAKLGRLYLTEHAKLAASLKAPQAAAWKKHRTQVEAFVTRLTKDGKIDEAKTVREELVPIDASIAALTTKLAAELPEAAAWNGDWDVSYENGATRVIRVTMLDATTLKVQSIGGTWEPAREYTATFDADKKCFIAPQAAEPGTHLRSESYVLQGKRIVIRHWLNEGTYEKPSVKATTKRTKEG